jgi:hypothetical protein
MRYIAITCMILASISAASAEMSHEETMVRTAYAKLSYAVDLETAMRAVRHNPKITYAQLAQEVAKESLTFRLSNFSVGDIASLPQNHKYYEFFPDIRDGGDVIDIGNVAETLTEEKDGLKTETRMDVAQPRWSHGPLGDLPDLTLAQALPIMEQESGVPSLVRYCTYNVTVTFEGRSRTYRAAFYFGPQWQPDAGDMVVALGGGALPELLVKPVYPQVLVETTMWGKHPAVRAFLEANQRSNETCRSGEACCDLSALQCGIYSADLKGGHQ